MKIKIFLICLTLCLPAIVNAQIPDPESERIKGVATFLLDRANENFLYIFENNLKKNQYFACYFPATYDYAQSGHLRALLRSGGDVWKQTVRQDLNWLSNRTLLLIWYKTHGYINTFFDQYVLLMQSLEIEVDGVNYPLHYIPLDAPAKVRDIINEFYLYIEPAALKELKLAGIETAKPQNDDKQPEQQDKACFDNKLESLIPPQLKDEDLDKIKETALRLKKQIGVLKKHKDKLRLPEEKIKQTLIDTYTYNQLKREIKTLEEDAAYLRESGEKYINRLTALEAQIKSKRTLLIKLESRVSEFELGDEQLRSLLLSLLGKEEYQLKDLNIEDLLKKSLPPDVEFFIRNFDTKFFNYVEFYLEIKDDLDVVTENADKTSNLVKVIKVEQILNKAIEKEVMPFLAEFEAKEFNQFKRYIVFFAEVADAKTSESVQALLKEITLPPVSFGKKRNEGEEKWLITAYLGVAGGQEESQAVKRDEFFGLFAPIGLEYTFSRHRGYSHSVMLSPLDFGHPVNLEIEDRDESVKFGDIFVPGIYYSLGLKDMPLTVGFGFNKGKALKTNYRDEERWLVFIAFDMPLFTVY